MTPRAERRLHLLGWLLFLACAVVYLLAGLQSGDVLLTVGSLLFLIACLLFLWPLVIRRHPPGAPGAPAGHDRGDSVPRSGAD